MFNIKDLVVIDVPHWKDLNGLIGEIVKLKPDINSYWIRLSNGREYLLHKDTLKPFFTV